MGRRFLRVPRRRLLLDKYRDPVLKLLEVFGADSRLPQNTAKRAGGNFAMLWNGRRPRSTRDCLSKLYVAA